MRGARKLMALAAAVVAIASLSASTASAQDFEVTEEATGDPCTIETCVIHLVSEEPTVVTAHIFGSESAVSECSDEFEVGIDDVGAGHVYDQVSTGEECTRRTCSATGGGSDGEGEWPFELQAPALNVKVAHVELCLESVSGGGSDLHCEVDLDVVETLGHEFDVEATDAQCGGGAVTLEVTGQWAAEETNFETTETGNIVGQFDQVNFGSEGIPSTMAVRFYNRTGAEQTVLDPTFYGFPQNQLEIMTGCVNPAYTPPNMVPNNGWCEVTIQKMGSGIVAPLLAVKWDGGSKRSCQVKLQT